MKADIKNVRLREFDFLGEIRAEKGPGKLVRKYYVVIPRELIKLGLKTGDLVEVKIKKIENII